MTLQLLERENAKLREALAESEQRLAVLARSNEKLEQRAQVLADALKAVARD